MATTVAFRALDDAGKLPDNYVNPYYLEDLKRRVSVARAMRKAKCKALTDVTACTAPKPRRRSMNSAAARCWRNASRAGELSVLLPARLQRRTSRAGSGAAQFT